MAARRQRGLRCQPGADVDFEENEADTRRDKVETADGKLQVRGFGYSNIDEALPQRMSRGNNIKWKNINFKKTI